MSSKAGVDWSPGALGDLDRVLLFLQFRNPSAASRASLAIMDSIERVRQFPVSGRPYSAPPDHLREVVVPFGRSGYVVLYDVQPDRILIVAVRRQRESGY